MTTYRQEQPAPTESGWYYGVNLPENREVPVNDAGLIVPVYVSRRNDGSVTVDTRDMDLPVSQWRWFGPVPECKEG